MASRLSLTILVLIVFFTVGKAQTTNQQSDSTSLSLFNQAEWTKLIDFGTQEFNSGYEEKFLRLRVAYAYFVRNKFTDALYNYDKVLQADKQNQIALYYAYLCNVYLNRLEDAGFLASKLDTNIIEGSAVKSFKLLGVGAESGVKFTNVFERGNSSFSRAFLNMRLDYKLSLSTSFNYYKQPVRDESIQQPGYYAKLNYALARKINVIGAYHYLRSSFRNLIYQNNVGLLGFKYSDNRSDLQADFILSQIGDEKTRQYNLKFTKYITGNLDFYSISRASVIEVLGQNNMVFQQILGFKPVTNFWVEGMATVGNQYNYAEADAVYIYNGFDKTRFKAGANCYFLLKRHLLLGLNYTFEKKTDNIFRFNYLQHSINGGISWNF
ncbi:hypothetical protein [Pedobacter aquatilis]|uniref:hypothetical protein n=1 Tax=Pedobacter aquatilis TaxID=351343 RepID=UPI00292EC5B1|nr:hypothetical protein [Pedobacter aquatilis]